MAERMVALKSTVRGTVVIKKPEYGVNRKWLKRGQTQIIPFDLLSQLLYDNGVRRMIDSGILYIEDMQTKKDLGLEPAEATQPTNIIAVTEESMKKLWTTTSINVFKREVSKMPAIQVDNLVEYAIETETIDAEKCRFLKEVTGKDILRIIARNQEIEEEERRERENAAIGRR